MARTEVYKLGDKHLLELKAQRNRPSFAKWTVKRGEKGFFTFIFKQFFVTFLTVREIS